MNEYGLKTKVCIVCGKEFIPHHCSSKTCSPECRKKREKDRRAENIGRSIQKRIKKVEDSQQRITDKTVMARKLGLSYGEYVAQCYASNTVELGSPKGNE